MNAGWSSAQWVWSGCWRIGVVVMLLLGSPWLRASDAPSLDSVLVASGVDAQMPVFGKLVQATLAQNPAFEEGEQREVLLHVAMESLRSDVIYRHVQTAVEETLKPGDLATLQLWYDSPLGKTITAMELKAQEGDVLPAMKAAAESLQADTERMAAASRLDALTQSSALGVTLQQRALLANHMAESIAMQPDAPVDTTALDAQLASLREPMRQLMQQQTVLSLAFTYRELPVDRIASYESFLATSAAQRYQQGLKQGLLSGVDAVLMDWDKGLREFYRGD